MVVTAISSGKKSISGGRNTQSRVEKSRVEKSRERDAENRFTPPTAEEVRTYCSEKGYKVDPERFVDFYTSKGWLVGKTKMKDWKAAVRNWARSDGKEKTTTRSDPVKERAKKNSFNNFKQRDYDFSELEKAVVNR